MPRAILSIGLALALWCLAGSGGGASHAAKPKTPPRAPDLKILSVAAMPLPFAPTEKPLTLTITVELPKNLPDEGVLNVSALITSPSKSSIRLLEKNQPLTGKIRAGAAQGEHQRVEIVLRWDGTDHMKQVVGDGIYDYLVQAKLMAVGKNGPLTRETAWRKRGTLEVRTR